MATVRADCVRAGDVVDVMGSEPGAVRSIDLIDIPGSTVHAATVEHPDGSTSVVNWTDDTDVTVLRSGA